MNFQNRDRLGQNIDWLTIGIYAIFVIAGWLNIFAAVYDVSSGASIFDWNVNSGKQLVWIATSMVLILVIMVIDFKFYSSFAYIIYAAMILLLIATIAIGKEVKGSHSWIQIGSFALQPAEFAKFGTALALANYLGRYNVKFEKLRTKVISIGILALPCIIILLQNETGQVLVFAAFVLVLYREGLSPLILILGAIIVAVFILTLLVTADLLVKIVITLAVIAILYTIYQIVYNVVKKKIERAKRLAFRILWIVLFTFFLLAEIIGVNHFVYKVLKPHQRNRIITLFDPEADPKGIGYNVIQSKIAIGSGQFIGKGFLQGTQTKMDFVPEQSTDFIFCTIGEEHGWLGSSLIIGLFIVFLLRLVFLAERQKDKFARIYGYSVACIVFFHFMVNIGMTIGLFPVIGIPLPFFSYGGSSLWSFTILLFVFLKLDAHRKQVLGN